TVLAFEEPYVFVLANYLTWDTTHCHFCSEKISGGVPCTGCSFAMYCDEKCRYEAATNHSFEHNMLPYHHCHESAIKDLISLRIIIKAGPQFLFNLFQRQKHLIDGNATSDIFFNPNEDTIFGLNESGVYDSKSYLPIYHLISHARQIPLKEAVSNVFRAVVLTCLLRETSKFFDSLKAQYSSDYPQDEFEDFMVSLISKNNLKNESGIT
ncbi:SET and MYND domain-containing protein 4, partial [Pseudolycoriella hygida]